jgi:hypothetical protein
VSSSLTGSDARLAVDELPEARLRRHDGLGIHELASFDGESPVYEQVVVEDVWEAAEPGVSCFRDGVHAPTAESAA